jgi:glutamyl-Q tRNA(Asp) synthetase
LHFGSLVAAVASYVDAQAHDGEWLVRMEDVDKPREEAGAAEGILRDLEFFGFQWHGPVMIQSQRTGAYRAALDRLRDIGAVYPCSCSRQEVCACRDGLAPGKQARAWRVRASSETIVFEDRRLGPQSIDLTDFVVLRADRLFAYQLAVVVDDAEQGITDVVRGADLLDSTPRQIHLQRLLGLPTPRYFHVPVATNEQGEKLSKQTRAPALDRERAPQLLCDALRFLGYDPPTLDSIADVWAWTKANRARFSHPQSSSPSESV